MRILLTGSEGYIGSILGPYLVARGHTVIGLDTGFHRIGWLYNAVGMAPQWLNRDIRTIGPDDLRGFDAVVHLAELSNDPVGALNPEITYEINHRGSVRLAELARSAGVERFVYMSSCSVYGTSEGEPSTEDSPLNPLTAYAQCKALVERDVRPLAADGFSPTFLRNATAYGASPRLRFDLVVNDLAGHAWTAPIRSSKCEWPRLETMDSCRAASGQQATGRSRISSVNLSTRPSRSLGQRVRWGTTHHPQIQGTSTSMS